MKTARTGANKGKTDEYGKVINRRGSYRQSSAQDAKKAEGKKRKSPCTPFREKGKGKEIRRGFSRKPSIAGGRARVRALVAAEVAAAADAFGGNEDDVRIWAAIAWRVGAEAFHFAVHDKLAEDAVDGRPRHPAAAFQAFLNGRFPKDGDAGEGGVA